MLLSGTNVTYGRGRAVLVATGVQTEMGRSALMLKEAGPQTTPLQKELDRVGKTLGLIVVVIAGVMITAIIFSEHVTGAAGLFAVLVLGVALAVAANGIFRHLTAVETPGSASIIASDEK